MKRQKQISPTIPSAYEYAVIWGLSSLSCDLETAIFAAIAADGVTIGRLYKSER